ncbi:rab-GTPase-TBC domain-domain-containing protein [Absidia repens]|uniref:Rab-GTPase-TBC domain-domain-containing protein n=1 Tax=Absidia repens TaxID=90262 RepID=A0A1X2J3I0_9FUNG|nr:rab-GTPase-TBC domain-domain-containing protein [Absidia repens]
MTQPASNEDTNANDQKAANQLTASINDALLTDDTKQAIQATTSDNSARQRERSQTVTQNDIQPSSLYMSDQDNLFHAIQKFDTVEHVDPHDSDSDFELDQGPSIKSNRSTVTSISSLLSSDTTYDMLLNRMGSNSLKANVSLSFDPSLSPTTPFSSSTTAVTQQEHDTDWEFWSQMISDADQVIKTNKQYIHHIRQGVPESLRGSVWPALSKTKTTKYNSNNITSASMVDGVFDGQSYLDLLNMDNIYEKAIARDLDVLFADQDSLFAANAMDQLRDPLFHLLKAYANYDGHVGYAKGFALIALPLLLHTPEEEAFCIFVELMNGVYQWKSLYQPPLNGLSRTLFLMDRLIMEHLPKLYQHLQASGIHTNDYAKIWFTAFFIPILPSLDCIYSLYDTLLAEGTDVLFGCGVALLKVNQDSLLALMEPDDLINYLSGAQMGDFYKNDSKRLMQDAMDLKIQNKRLVKLSKEHQQMLSSISWKKSVPLSIPSLFPPSSVSTTAVATSASISESAIVSAINDKNLMQLTRQQNKALIDNVKQRQLQLEQLSKQQGHSTEELMDAKMELARARQSNDDLRQQSFDLKRALDALPAEVEDRLKQHIHSLVGKNMGLVDRNSELEYQLTAMENMLKDIKAKFAQSENERDELNLRLEELLELVN